MRDLEKVSFNLAMIGSELVRDLIKVSFNLAMIRSEFVPDLEELISISQLHILE